MTATGNPILDSPTLKAAMMAQMQPQAPPPAPIAFPPGGAGPVPSIPAATAPTVFSTTGKVTGPGANAPRGTLLGDQTELSRKLTSGSGISQIGRKIESSGFGQKHPVLGKVLGIGAQGLAELGDIGLSSVAPRVAAEIPGTELHHNIQVRHDQGQVAEDTANEGKQALTQKTLADIPYEQAQTENLQHPPATPLETSEGYYGFNPRTGEVTPIKGQNGEPLQPFVKPGNRQHVVLEDPAHPGNAMLGFVDPATGETTNAAGAVIPNPKPFEKPTTPQHITVMHDGKPHVMGADAAGNFTRDLGEAPPNYAMMAGSFRMAPAVLDTLNGNSPAIMTVDQLNAANAAQPGRFIPAGTSVPALKGKALIEDIRGNINSVRDVLQNPHLPPFTAGQRAKLAIVFGGGDKGAIDAMTTGAFMDSLNPEQQDYVIGLSQLVENAMAMRSVLGAGQGSDQLRDAIRRTIPTAANPNPQYSLKQLDAFEKVIDRLEKGIPNVKLGGGYPSPQAPKAGTVVDGYKFKGGDPADQKNWEEVKK